MFLATHHALCGQYDLQLQKQALAQDFEQGEVALVNLAFRIQFPDHIGGGNWSLKEHISQFADFQIA